MKRFVCLKEARSREVCARAHGTQLRPDDRRCHRRVPCEAGKATVGRRHDASRVADRSRHPLEAIGYYPRMLDVVSRRVDHASDSPRLPRADGASLPKPLGKRHFAEHDTPRAPLSRCLWWVSGPKRRMVQFGHSCQVGRCTERGGTPERQVTDSFHQVG